ncbi:forkhead box protein J1-B-like [Gouania willdenowi]|uniref:forkhead box protein J1-B-like n=1 Tax=Gouania willdenowi TaxID=441366 RepID=UPI0010564A73|nr:forkhead box protein J1-B-like [Gouania willdenowi]
MSAVIKLEHLQSQTRMPVFPMPRAKRFKVDRLEMYLEDQVQGSGPAPLDDTLTSLHWLQDFSILSSDPEWPSGPGCPSSQEQLFLRRLGNDSPSSLAVGDTAAPGMAQYLGSDSTVGPHPRIQEQPIPLVEVVYKTDPKVKPPCSHASLICMAMQASKQPKVTVSDIFKWITENFCYYKHTEPTWKNSIRHTLSRNKCFRKVPKQKDEPSKGGFWQIDPEYADMFVNGIFKGRTRTLRRNNGFQGYQDTARTSANEDVTPEQKPLLSKNNRRTTRSTKTPLLATKPDSMRVDILAAALQEVLGGDCSTLEDSDLNAALRSLECEMEGMQEPIGELGRWWGDVMNQQLSYGYMDLCVTTTNGTGNVAELQTPQHYLYQHQDHLNESSVSGEGAEVKVDTVTVPPTLDPGFGLSEGFFTATCDHPPPPTLTVL